MRLVLLLVGIMSILVAKVEGQQYPSTQYDILVLMPDTSGSLDESEDTACRTYLADYLVNLVQAFHIKEVWLQPWAGSTDVWSSPQVTVKIPSIQFCSYEPRKLTSEEKIFKNAQRLAERKARRKYEADSVQAERLLLQAISDSLGRIASALTGLRQGNSHCTALSDLAYRCAEEDANVFIIIISDAEPICQDLPSETMVNKSGRAKTVLFLVPGKNDRSSPNLAKTLEARKEALRRVVPWIYVLPSYKAARPWLSEVLK